MRSKSVNKFWTSFRLSMTYDYDLTPLTRSPRMILKYEGSQIVNSSTGDGFDEFQQQFHDDERAFAYLRINVSTNNGCLTSFNTYFV